MNSLIRLIRNATRPRSQDEDRARREFIFNVLSLGALGILFVGIIDDAVHAVVSAAAMHQADSLSSFSLYGIFAFIAILYMLSLRGHALVASYVLLATLFDIAAYMGFRWGVDLSASLLFYALVITMSGILISAQFAFVTAALAGLAIGIVAHLHGIGYAVPDRSWIMEAWKIDDVIVAALIFLVIALVMWLSNREIEKSLVRARRSEADLKLERDSLEIRVEERTRELRQAELERMTQAYRFVEFGRIASGVFHDLMNPLAGLTLNIERIADASTSRSALAEDVERAKRAAQHMQDLLNAMRRHLKREAHSEPFSAAQALADAVRMISTYARENGVACLLEIEGDAEIFGDAVAFTQAILNLLGNAVQAYPPLTAGDVLRPVRISLARIGGGACIRITDSGAGMSATVRAHIFEPYFTTKGSDGIGLGLSLTKHIIEKDFNGRIEVESEVGEGTTFVLFLPTRASVGPSHISNAFVVQASNES